MKQVVYIKGMKMFIESTLHVESGEIIKNMDLVNKHGKTEINMKENGRKVKGTEVEHSG